MKCLICFKELEPVEHGESQPYDGGEIQVRFGFGSRHDQEFNPDGQSRRDGLLGCQQIVAYICDDCFDQRIDCFEGYSIENIRKRVKVV